MYIKFSERDYDKLYFDCTIGHDTEKPHGYILHEGFVLVIHTIAYQDYVMPCVSVYSVKEQELLGAFCWEWDDDLTYEDLMDDFKKLAWEVYDQAVERDAI